MVHLSTLRTASAEADLQAAERLLFNANARTAAVSSPQTSSAAPVPAAPAAESVSEAAGAANDTTSGATAAVAAADTLVSTAAESVSGTAFTAAPATSAAAAPTSVSDVAAAPADISVVDHRPRALWHAYWAQAVRRALPAERVPARVFVCADPRHELGLESALERVRFSLMLACVFERHVEGSEWSGL
jgi:hypothetical protein